MPDDLKSPKERPREGPSATAGISLKGCRVLVIEDEYFLAKDLENSLSAAGAGVVGPIPNIADAVEQAAQGAFDVAVIDINLRGFASFVIAEQLQDRGVPFLFATGYSDVSIPARFRNVTRWEKPYLMDRLLADIARLCRETAAP
jgi:DNA-binding NtrC family response regulator